MDKKAVEREGSRQGERGVEIKNKNDSLETFKDHVSGIEDVQFMTDERKKVFDCNSISR